MVMWRNSMVTLLFWKLKKVEESDSISRQFRWKQLKQPTRNSKNLCVSYVMSFIQSIFNVLIFHRRNWKAVALCIFAATVFWLFNALNKSYTTNINLPLTFDYDQDSYIAVRP